MATSGGPLNFPKWLIDSKETIVQTPEWMNFTKELYDAIEQQVKESRVDNFTDLTQTERSLFMDRACKALENSDSFKKMYNGMAGCVDACLNREVSRQLLEDFPLDTKSDLILTQAQDGAISLLRKWPDMKYKLHVYLNHQLPSNLRLVAWRLFLENTKIRKEYTDILSTNPRYAISPQDLDISRTCEQLLIHESSFNELKGYVGAFYAMKAVLSYHHARMKTEKKLPSADFMLAAPFVQVSLPNISKREPATASVAALLVEEYLTFMESRPNFMMHASQKQSQEGLRGVAVKVGKHLKNEANELVKPIVLTSYENKEKIVESDKGLEEAFKKALMELIHPLLRTLFVGYLKMDTLVFCWDQVILGRDVAEWISEIVPALVATFLYILRNHLKNKSTVEEWHKTLKEEGQKLTASQFQYEINKFFIEDLRKILNQEDRASMPVLDPTYTPYPAWKNWHDDAIPPRIGPVQRRTNRNARQLEREKEAKEKELEEERKRRILEEEKLKEEERFAKELARDRRRIEETRIRLEDELEEEKQKRRAIEDELRKLKDELEDSKAIRKKLSPEDVNNYLVPPAPPVPRSTSVQADLPIHTPTPDKPTRQQAQQVMRDLLCKVVLSFTRVNHSTGQELKKLNEDTVTIIKQHKRDSQAAEIKVFGRKLAPGELEMMPPDHRDRACQAMMEIIRRGLVRRRQQELAAQSPSYF